MKKYVSMMSVVLPLQGAQWMDLQYSDLKNNKVSMGEKISIQVNESASPLFHVFDKRKKISKVYVEGKVKIEKNIDPKADDSYFQLGIIEHGNYKANAVARWFLPKWLKTLLELNRDAGLGDIHFYGVTDQTTLGKKKETAVTDIDMSFQNLSKIDDKGRFKLEVPVKTGNDIIGFWLRSDGDDSKAKFDVTIESITFD
jgi:hypothetical protein